MTAKVTLQFMDRTYEISRVEYCLPTSSAANVEGQIDDSNPETALSTAALVASLSLCTPVGYALKATEGKLTRTLPGNDFAQRELALMISYADNVTGKIFHLTVPGPDWTNLAAAGSDNVDPTKAKWIAFVAQFESEAVSPDGNPITVQGGKLVGRNR